MRIVVLACVAVSDVFREGLGELPGVATTLGSLGVGAQLDVSRNIRAMVERPGNPVPLGLTWVRYMTKLLCLDFVAKVFVPYAESVNCILAGETLIGFQWLGFCLAGR